MATPDTKTANLLRFSLAERELHTAIDALEVSPEARALLKTLGTAYLSERKTKWWSIPAAEANAFLRQPRMTGIAWLYLTMFTSAKCELCWSLAPQPLLWRAYDEWSEVYYYLSSEPPDTPFIKREVSNDLIAQGDPGLLFEAWHPKAGGFIPQRKDGPLARYLDAYVSDAQNRRPPHFAPHAQHPPRRRRPS